MNLRALLDQQKWEEALAHLDAEHKRDEIRFPQDTNLPVMWHFGRGGVFLEMGEFQKCVDEWTCARERASDRLYELLLISALEGQEEVVSASALLSEFVCSDLNRMGQDRYWTHSTRGTKFKRLVDRICPEAET